MRLRQARPVEILLGAPIAPPIDGARASVFGDGESKPNTLLRKRGQDRSADAGDARRADGGDHRQDRQPLEGGAEIGHAVGAGRDRLRLAGSNRAHAGIDRTVRMPGPAGLASAEITRTIVAEAIALPVAFDT